MAKSASPFAGIKLSDQTKPGNRGLDQQLFAPARPKQLPQPTTIDADQKPENRKTSNQELWQTRKPKNKIAGIQENQQAGKPANKNAEKQELAPEATSTAMLFDVNEEPTRKDTYWIAEDEFEILEDVKRELRRKFDLKVTKGELVRCAIHLLNKHYQKDGETSDIVQSLQRKKIR
jgi:hypothetical protein